MSTIKTRASLVGLLVALCMAGGAAAGETASSPHAEKLLQLAIDRFADGEFAESRALLYQAQGRTHSPGLRARISLYLGLIAAAENNSPSAREHFRAALLHDPRLRLDPLRYKPQVVELFGSVLDSLFGHLAVNAPRADLEVWIDGQRAGTTPFQAALRAGRHTVEVRMRAGQVFHRSTVEVSPGQTARLELTQPTAGAPATAATPRPPGPSDEPAPRRRRLWTWVAGASALAFAAIAIGVGVAASRESDEACELLAAPPLPCEERKWYVSAADAARYEQHYRSIENRTLAANISWAAAGTVAASAVLLFWLEGRAADRKRRAGLSRSVRVGPSPAPGVSLRVDY